MLFGLGPTEFIIIVVLVALLFGVSRLPFIGNALGRTVRQFRRGITEDADE